MQRRDFLRVGVGAAGIGVHGASRTSASGVETAELPESYAPLGWIELESAYETVVGEDGRVAYVATGDGYATVDLSDPSDPTLLASRDGLLADEEDGPIGLIWDVAVDGDRLLVVGPAHGHGSFTAAVLIDVSDPADPERIAVHRTGYPIHNADLAGGYAYLTGNDGVRNPLVVVDVDDADGPREVARWSVVDRNADWADVHAALRVLHDVQVVDGVAYLAYWDAGTHLLDVSDPESPERVGSVEPYDADDLVDIESEGVRVQQQSPPGNHHRALPNEDGDLMAVNVESWAVELDDGELVGDSGGVHLYDVSDPSAPERLATIDPPETPDPTIDGVWSTSHNFDLRGDRLYTSWYEAGVRVHDVSDPTAPDEIASWRDPVDASFWTAQVGVPGEFFVASSTGHRPTESALYTFPDRSGEQVDPPSLQDAVDAGDESSRSAPTETPEATPTPSPTPTGDDSSSNGGSDADDRETNADDETDETSETTPGFGAGAAAAAVSGAAWWVQRRGRGLGEADAAGDADD